MSYTNILIIMTFINEIMQYTPLQLYVYAFQLFLRFVFYWSCTNMNMTRILQISGVCFVEKTMSNNRWLCVVLIICLPFYNFLLKHKEQLELENIWHWSSKYLFQNSIELISDLPLATILRLNKYQNMHRYQLSNAVFSKS